MRRALLTSCGLLSGAILSGQAGAQSLIDPNDKHAWSENIGWTNWADADSGGMGVAVFETHLEGYIWAENAGWISVGLGPANGAQYVNANGSDAGVNIDVNGDLFGFAWAENLGWVNFDSRTALSASGAHARFDRAAGRFRGYAWIANAGWLNLDDAEHFVAVAPECIADLTTTGATLPGQPGFGSPDGAVDLDDLGYYLNAWLLGDPSIADVTTTGATLPGQPGFGMPDGAVGLDDLGYYLNFWLLGCL